MRRAAFALIAAAFAAFPGNGEARDYPWCADMVVDYDHVTNCGFDTFEQCLATISGVGLCRRNFQYVPQSQAVPPRKAKKPRS